LAMTCKLAMSSGGSETVSRCIFFEPLSSMGLGPADVGADGCTGCPVSRRSRASDSWAIARAAVSRLGSMVGLVMSRPFIEAGQGFSEAPHWAA
jgi:hypothetical protein